MLQGIVDILLNDMEGAEPEDAYRTKEPATGVASYN
jgi:hypothetical protein